MKKLQYIFLFSFLFVSGQLLAQGEKEPIYISGVVVDSQNSDPLPGVHIYIPKAGRGTTSGSEGFFAIPTLPGDSLIVSFVGYKRHFYKVPQDKSESFSVVIELLEDTTSLPVIEVFPYPTEELFKEAVLALELPDEELIQNMKGNLNPQTMTIMAMSMPMDANMNYRNSMMQNVYRLETRTSIPTLQLLNPFAWANFIKSIKRGDFKKKDKKR